jgi:hypothetical protein
VFDFFFDTAVGGDRRPTGQSLFVDLQIRFDIPSRYATTGEVGWYDVAGLLSPILQPDSEISGDRIVYLGAFSG